MKFPRRVSSGDEISGDEFSKMRFQWMNIPRICLDVVVRLESKENNVRINSLVNISKLVTIQKIAWAKNLKKARSRSKVHTASD